jgi:hypothetical protein
MWKSLLSVTLLLTGTVLSSCGTNTTVSQYAGLPRNALPRDHFEYVPANADLRERSSEAASQPDAKSAANFSLDDENQRLAKVLRICRNCEGVAPSHESTETAQAAGDPSSTLSREAQARR